MDEPTGEVIVCEVHELEVGDCSTYTGYHDPVVMISGSLCTNRELLTQRPS